MLSNCIITYLRPSSEPELTVWHSDALLGYGDVMCVAVQPLLSTLLWLKDFSTTSLKNTGRPFVACKARRDL